MIRIIQKLCPDLRSAGYIVIPVLAFLARFLMGLARLDEPLNDPDQYLPFATSLWSGKGFVYNGLPTAYRPPLFPLILAPLVGLLGTGIRFKMGLYLLHALMGAATTWLVMRIVQNGRQRDATQYGIKTCAILTGGVLTAFDPLLLAQAALPMTETLAALLVTLGLHGLVYGRNTWSGLAFGLAALSRPSLLACVGLILICRFWPISRLDFKRQVRDSLQIGVVVVLVLTPWAVRNCLIFGEPVWTTTHGGYTFALANNPVYYDEVLFGPPGAVWTGPRQQAWMDSVGPMTAGMTEPEANRFLEQQTWAFVRSQPRAFLASCIDRQWRLWAVAPSGQVYGLKVRLATALWTVPFWLAVAAGLWSRESWAWPERAAIAASAGLAVVHLLYWTDIRMRAPIVPALAVVASGGVAAAVAKKVQAWSPKPSKSA